MPPDPAAPVVLKRNPNALSAVIDDEVMLMNVERGSYYALDGVASDVWNRLEKAPTQAQLIEDLVSHYSGEPASIERDTLDLLAELSAEGLIDMEPAPATAETDR